MVDSACPRTHLLRSYRGLLHVMFSRVSMVVLLLVLIAVAFMRFVSAGVGWLDLFILLAGFFLFSLGEWGFHRYIWHVRPLPLLGCRIESPISAGHGGHHRVSEDIDGLFFRTPAIILYILVSGFLAFFLLHLSPQAITLIAALLASLLYHEWVHLLCHSDVPVARGPWAVMKANHAFHHQCSADSCYAIMLPYWDTWLGTGNGHAAHSNPTGRSGHDE